MILCTIFVNTGRIFFAKILPIFLGSARSSTFRDVRQSVRRSVGPSVCPSVGPSVRPSIEIQSFEATDLKLGG